MKVEEVIDAELTELVVGFWDMRADICDLQATLPRTIS